MLDEYVKNRDVWQCPSARILTGAAFIVPMGRNGLWYNAYRDNLDSRGTTWGYDRSAGLRLGPCNNDVYPVGWGGTITDSFLQGATYSSGRVQAKRGELGGTKVFLMGIAVMGADGVWAEPLRGKKLAAFDNVAQTVVVTDSSTMAGIWPMANFTMHPEICGPQPCGANWPDEDGNVCCLWDPLTMELGVDKFSLAEWNEFHGGGPLSKKYTRHLGGSNLGFMDGHAAWMAAGTIAQKVRDDELFGFCGVCPDGPV